MNDTAPSSPDFLVEHHGTISLLAPQSPDAEQWLRDSVDGEAMWLQGALIVERRYLGPIVDGARDEGWVVA